MCQLILLVVSTVYVYVDAHVVCPCRHSYGRSRELRAQLIKTISADLLGRTIDPEGGDWWMVGRLLGQVGDTDWLHLRVCLGNYSLSILFVCYWYIIYDVPVAL